MSNNGTASDQSLLIKTSKLRDDLLEAAAKLAVYAEALSEEATRIRKLAEEAAEKASRGIGAP